MSQEELKEIIEKLKAEHKSESAYFGIFQYGGGPDESFIKATKEGLALHATEILEALSKFNAGEFNQENGTLSLDQEAEWMDGDTLFDHIELTTKPELENNQPYKEKWYDKLVPVGCIGLAILILISAVVGAITIFKLIVN